MSEKIVQLNEEVTKGQLKELVRTVLVKFPLYRPKREKEIRVNVVQPKMVLSEEPDE